jgi:hypothetical protein
MTSVGALFRVAGVFLKFKNGPAGVVDVFFKLKNGVVGVFGAISN